MTFKEACNILGVTREDNNTSLKLKFRKLMLKHHPDAVGSDELEHIEKAQLLNEAFAMLRDTLGDEIKETEKQPVWEGNVVEDAFTERTIYMFYKIWDDDEIEFVEVIKGKYEWDPELEEFECLLKSLNYTVLELLENTEQANGIYEDEYRIQDYRMKFQIQLFHLLAGQFIPPVASLNKIAKPYQIDKMGKSIYRFQAFLTATEKSEAYQAMSVLKSGDQLLAVSLANNRIMVSDTAGNELGYLSLNDDQLYYVIIPILKNHRAKVKFFVKETMIRRVHPYAVKAAVHLYLRMDDTTEINHVSEQNKKIKEVLKQYDSMLKNL